MIEQIMEYNKKFVENKGYEPYITSKYPDKKIEAIEMMDYGRMDGEKVLNHVKEVLGD